jgi:predicted small lipoprotein YifL
MKQYVVWLLVLTAAAFLITSCGKRGGLEQPEDVKPTYPRVYPSE